MKRKLFDSLFKKIALWQCAALLLFSLVTGILFGFSYLKYTYETYLQEVSKSISRSIGSYLENTGVPLVSRETSEANLYTVLLSTASNMSDMSVCIISKDREMISYNKTTGELEYNHLPTRYDDMLDQLLSDENANNSAYRKIRDRSMFGVATPITDKGGSVVGAVLVETPYQVVSSALKTVMRNLFISFLIAMILTLLIATGVFRIITAPLGKIQASAKRLQEGKYDVRIGLGQQDQLGQLADSVDTLAQRLEEAERQRQQLDISRQNFISNISHELRTPVASIRASLEALCDGLIKDPAKKEQYYHAMLQDSIHLHRLIDDLLDLSSLQAPEFQTHKTKLNLCQVVEDAVTGLQPLADKKNLRLHFSSCQNHACCTIRADRGRLFQLFTILLDNAIKFTPEGKAVSVSVDNTKTLCCIIEDQGCGISPQILPHIFEQFYRGPESLGSQGSGLGLAIAAQIADRHNIEIQVESKPEKGTRFILYFKDSVCCQNSC